MADTKNNRIRLAVDICMTVLNVIFFFIADTGLCLFLKNGIPGYIFFRTPFAMFDYDKAGIIVFLENIAVLFFFAFAGANTVRLIKAAGAKCRLNIY